MGHKLNKPNSLVLIPMVMGDALHQNNMVLNEYNTIINYQLY